MKIKEANQIVEDYDKLLRGEFIQKYKTFKFNETTKLINKARKISNLNTRIKRYCIDDIRSMITEVEALEGLKIEKIDVRLDLSTNDVYFYGHYKPKQKSTEEI